MMMDYGTLILTAVLWRMCEWSELAMPFDSSIYSSCTGTRCWQVPPGHAGQASLRRASKFSCRCRECLRMNTLLAKPSYLSGIQKQWVAAMLLWSIIAKLPTLFTLLQSFINFKTRKYHCGFNFSMFTNCDKIVRFLTSLIPFSLSAFKKICFKLNLNPQWKVHM